MNKILSMLDGKRTYTTTFVMALFNFLNIMGWVNLTTEQTASINGLLVAAIALFLRKGVKKSGAEL